MHTRDGYIVHQCLSGNTEAFALLVDKYKERIFALVYAKVGQFQDAEDLTQDIFLNAYKKLSTLRRWDNFYPWLYSIAVNRCKNFYRAQKDQVETMNLLARNLNHQAAVDADSEAVRVEQLHEALASLPEMHRQVLMLRYMAGMKSKEIAQTLRVSPNTIDQRLVRARAKLKTVLSEEMIPMIRTAFAERKLQSGFTARVVELIRDSKIQTAPHKTALPLGLSAVGGVILLLLSLNLPHSPLYPLGEWLGGSLPLNTQVVEDGALPVDVEATRVAILGAEGEDGDFGQKPEPRKAPAAIGQAEEMDNPNEEITITGIHLPDDFDIMWYADISPDGRQLVHVSTRNEWNWTQLVIYPLIGLDTMMPTSRERKVILEEQPDKAKYFRPKWSPDGKWIAFYRQVAKSRGKGTGVYLIPATGGEMRFVAQSDSDHAGRLSWSPDSEELAFVRGQEEATDIYIVSIDTGMVRPFTTDGKENTDPSWSPDGKWISYRSRKDSSFRNSFSAWKQSVDDGKVVRTNHRVGLDPLIHSPDGRWIANTGFLPDGQSGFVAARVNEQGELTGEPTLLKAARLQVGAKPLRWTPDGKLMVLQEASGHGVVMTYAFDVKTGEQRRVSSELEVSFDDPMPAQWIGNGKRLFLPSAQPVLDENGRQYRNDMYRDYKRPAFLDIETSDIDETSRFAVLPIELPEGMVLGQSTLSPDEKWVAFVQFHFKKTTQVPSAQLHIIPVEGGKAKRLTHSEFSAFNPHWSPDGQKIAFINMKYELPDGFKFQLCVVSTSDGHVRTLTDSEQCMGFAWSPNGMMLAYLRMKGKGLPDFDDSEVDINLVPATGGESKRITAPPDSPPEGEILLPWTPDGKISWTPDGKRLTFEIGRQTWVMSINGGEPKPMRRNYIPSSWSSDGTSYLAIGRKGELHRVSLDGTTIDELPFRVPADARPLSMSPDGETILYRQVASGTLGWSIDVSHLANQ